MDNDRPNSCIIGVGSNIDAGTHIPRMLDLLGRKVRILRVSRFVTTSPIGISNQPDFTNGAIRIETRLTVDELKKLLVCIEDELGRDRTQPKFGPRTIDLDIVVWNGKIIDGDYYEREFLRKSVEEVE
jgi:2-amino-4-hydroxy-6-hydroxymethyldihydropteridine diphosphokinase